MLPVHSSTQAVDIEDMTKYRIICQTIPWTVESGVRCEMPTVKCQTLAKTSVRYQIVSVHTGKQVITIEGMAEVEFQKKYCVEGFKYTF